MKNYVIITLMFSCLLLSCGKNDEIAPVQYDKFDYRIDDVLYPKNAKLKRIYSVYNDNSKILRSEYEYNDLGKIIRVNSGFEEWRGYSLYLYNEKGQLEKISAYDKYLENPPVLIQTVIYSYDAEGNKVKELYEWENSNSEMQTSYFLYQYGSGKLVKHEHYWEGLQYCIVYEYKGDKLVKEKSYVPNEKDYGTTEHFYEEDLRVYSISYHKDPKSGFVSDVRRYYDQNDNLIKVVGNHPGLSSSAGATAFLTTTENEYE